MNAAWAYAARITDAFAKYGWMARTRGVEGGGKVEGLPVHTFPTDDGDVAMKCPTEIAISDRREFELSNLGFLPLLAQQGQRLRRLHGRPVVPEAQDLLRPGGQRQRRAVGQVQPDPVYVAVRPLPQGDGPRQDRLVHGSAASASTGSTTGSTTTCVAIPTAPATRSRRKQPLADAKVEVRAVGGQAGLV